MTRLVARLYEWTLHWCRTRYALPALVLIAIAEASFFPIPPDVLLIAMTLAHPEKWFRNAAATLAASLAGGFWAGRSVSFCGNGWRRTSSPATS